MTGKNQTRLLSALAMAALTFNVSAETTKTTWKASAELGFIQTSGNSESETLIAKFEGEKSYKQWEHFLNLEALNSSQNDESSAEKYLASAQSDYLLSERAYVFSGIDWEKDRFSGYAYQASWVVGAGYKVINNDQHKLKLEVAPGYRVSEPDPGETQEDVIAQLSEKYKWQISETSEFEQSLSSEIGDSNTRTRFNVALTSQINGIMSMKLGYGIKHNSDVAPGIEKTDRETSITLVFRMSE